MQTKRNLKDQTGEKKKSMKPKIGFLKRFLQLINP